MYLAKDPLVDLLALDLKSSSVGLKETDVLLLNKRQTRRPGGSLALAASQHLKSTRPLLPVLSGFATPGLRTSLFTLANGGAGGGGLPLNPRFSPRLSATSPPHGFQPPRRGVALLPKLPNSRHSSIELIAMEEKIRELEARLGENGPRDKQYALLEQENQLLGKELAAKNRELVAKIKDIQQKNEVIKEMELYTNEQYDRLGAYERELKDLRAKAELRSGSDQSAESALVTEENEKLKAEHTLLGSKYAKLREMHLKLGEHMEKQQKILQDYEARLQDANKNLVKQRENIKFEYDAIIENKIRAQESLTKKVAKLEEQLAALDGQKVEEYESQIEYLRLEGSQVFSFLVDYVKDTVEYVPAAVLKDKAAMIADNPVLERLNKNLESQLTEALLEHGNQTQELPLVFSEQTLILRSLLVYSKSKMKSIENLMVENKLAELDNAEILRALLRELSESYAAREALHLAKEQQLSESLYNTNYLLGKLSYNNKRKHKTHYTNVGLSQDRLLKLSDLLSQILGGESESVSPSSSMDSFLGLGRRERERSIEKKRGPRVLNVVPSRELVDHILEPDILVQDALVQVVLEQDALERDALESDVLEPDVLVEY